MGTITLETTDDNRVKYIIGKDEDGFYLLNGNAEYVDHMTLAQILAFIRLEEQGDLV